MTPGFALVAGQNLTSGKPKFWYCTGSLPKRAAAAPPPETQAECVNPQKDASQQD